MEISEFELDLMMAEASYGGALANILGMLADGMVVPAQVDYVKSIGVRFYKLISDPTIKEEMRRLNEEDGKPLDLD